MDYSCPSTSRSRNTSFDPFKNGGEHGRPMFKYHRVHGTKVHTGTGGGASKTPIMPAPLVVEDVDDPDDDDAVDDDHQGTEVDEDSESDSDSSVQPIEGGRRMSDVNGEEHSIARPSRQIRESEESSSGPVTSSDESNPYDHDSQLNDDPSGNDSGSSAEISSSDSMAYILALRMKPHGNKKSKRKYKEKECRKGFVSWLRRWRLDLSLCLLMRMSLTSLPNPLDAGSSKSSVGSS